MRRPVLGRRRRGRWRGQRSSALLQAARCRGRSRRADGELVLVVSRGFLAGGRSGGHEGSGRVDGRGGRLMRRRRRVELVV